MTRHMPLFSSSFFNTFFFLHALVCSQCSLGDMIRETMKCIWELLIAFEYEFWILKRASSTTISLSKNKEKKIGRSKKKRTKKYFLVYANWIDIENQRKILLLYIKSLTHFIVAYILFIFLLFFFTSYKNKIFFFSYACICRRLLASSIYIYKKKMCMMKRVLRIKFSATVVLLWLFIAIE